MELWELEIRGSSSHYYDYYYAAAKLTAKYIMAKEAPSGMDNGNNWPLMIPTIVPAYSTLKLCGSYAAKAYRAIADCPGLRPSTKIVTAAAILALVAGALLNAAIPAKGSELKEATAPLIQAPAAPQEQQLEQIIQYK